MVKFRAGRKSVLTTKSLAEPLPSHVAKMIFFCTKDRELHICTRIPGKRWCLRGIPGETGIVGRYVMGTIILVESERKKRTHCCILIELFVYSVIKILNKILVITFTENYG